MLVALVSWYQTCQTFQPSCCWTSLNLIQTLKMQSQCFNTLPTPALVLILDCGWCKWFCNIRNGSLQRFFFHCTSLTWQDTGKAGIKAEKIGLWFNMLLIIIQILKTNTQEFTNLYAWWPGPPSQVIRMNFTAVSGQLTWVIHCSESLQKKL